MVKLKCIGGKHNISFTQGVVYDKVVIIQKTNKICIVNDRGGTDWLPYKMSHNGNLRAGGGVFRIMITANVE